MIIPKDYGDRNVCIIGLGYVGLTLAVALAECGFNILGVEKSDHVLDCLAEGRAHFREPGLDPRIASLVRNGRLQTAPSIPADVKATVYVITVGTPLVAGQQTTQLGAIETVAGMIANVLKDGDLVLLRSTVRIGVTRDIVKPILDRAGVTYDLAFCPERTLEGRALVELRTLPQVVGGLTESATLRAAQFFSFMTPTIVKVRSLETAEVIKLVNNTQRDLMFAFANEVAYLCDAIGVIASEVIQAGNIGYPRGGLAMPGPVGGPCLEKDPYIFLEGVRMRGGDAELALAGRQLNERLPARTADRIAGFLKGRPSPRVAIAGLAFKGRPETSDLRGTMARPLIAELRRAVPGVMIVGFDPAVPRHEAETLEIAVADSIEAAINGADTCIFQTNHPQFERLRLEDLSARMAPDALIYDLWSQFDVIEHSLVNGGRYASLGGWLHFTGA